MLTHRSETNDDAADGAEKQAQAVAGRWPERSVDAQINKAGVVCSGIEDGIDVSKSIGTSTYDGTGL